VLSNSAHKKVDEYDEIDHKNNEENDVGHDDDKNKEEDSN
jgi:hypothetical protein